MNEPPAEARERVLQLAATLYGDRGAAELWERLASRLGAATSCAGARGRLPLDQRDLVLITYGDQVQGRDLAPLATLHRFIECHLRDLVSVIHLLPCFPSSSDDGFSVIDHRTIDPRLGGWGDVERLATDYRLMLDAVINHASAQGEWFAAYCRGDAPYDQYFIATDPLADLSAVLRPREHALLTPYATAGGRRHLWTTFSADQVDLSYRSVALTGDIIEILLDYVEHGAALLRLDAVGFLYKEIGTHCLHLPQTHTLVRLMRAVLDIAAPETLLVAEVNGPDAENLAYFGNDADEAQLVYSFALPPLVLHALLWGDGATLTQYLTAMPDTGDRCTRLNFLAGHDGIGMRPVEGLLSAAALDDLCAALVARGGVANHRLGPGGAPQIYEIVSTFFDALAAPGESLDGSIARFRAAHAILLALRGLPGLYFHSLFGGANWRAGFERTGQARTLNRRKVALADLEVALADPRSRAARVFAALAPLIRARRQETAFVPTAPQRVLDLHPQIVAVARRAAAGHEVLCLVNVAATPVCVRLPGALRPSHDLLGAGTCAGAELDLEPYGVRWLRTEGCGNRG